MSERRTPEGNVARVAGAVTAIAVAVAALVAIVPRDGAPTVSSTIQNVVSVPASGPVTVRQASSRPMSRPSPAATAPATPPTAVDEWPGGSSYTAILASKPTEAQARAIQRTATERGLDAGVLFSSRFRSLRAGYWVVFSGAYASIDDASTHVQRARTLGFTDAYPRYVSP